MSRILAKLVDGPHDGQYWSAVDDLDKIENIGVLADTEDDSTGYYEKKPDTLRDLNELEVDLADLSFADHDLKQICEFHFTK